MDRVPRILRSVPSAPLWSTEAGDVGAATRGCHDAVARAPGVVVIYLGTWERHTDSQCWTACAHVSWPLWS